MMPDHGKIEELTDNIKSYVNTNFELIKYQAVERATVMMADTVTYVVIGLFMILFLFFISLWACFYLSSLFDNNHTGIAIVAGFYLLLGLILFMIRKKMIIKPLRNKIVHKIFQKEK